MDSEDGVSSIREEHEQKISQHEIVKDWSLALCDMSRHLSAPFERSSRGPSTEFFHPMGITTEYGIDKWFAAVNMSHHEDFHFYTTTSLSSDIKEYVTPRVEFILECLKRIEGKDRRHVHKKYIVPWQNAMDDRWRWASVLDKWRLQFQSMRNDLIRRFGGEEQVQAYFGGSAKWERFKSLLWLNDHSFDDINEDLDYSTDVDRVISFVKKTINLVISRLIEADRMAYDTGFQCDKARYISRAYMKRFRDSIYDKKEWKTLIGVQVPSTNWK